MRVELTHRMNDGLGLATQRITALPTLLMVDKKGIEPLLRDCKTRVLPLTLLAHKQKVRTPARFTHKEPWLLATSS